MTSTTTTTSSPSDSNDDVQVVPSRISVIPFAVSLPTSTLQGFDEPAPKGDPVALVGDNGVVGTILLLNNAVQVWVGWGKVRLGGSPLQPKGVTPCGMLNMVGWLELFIYLVDATAIVVMIHELIKPRSLLAHLTMLFFL